MMSLVSYIVLYLLLSPLIAVVFLVHYGVPCSLWCPLFTCNSVPCSLWCPLFTTVSLVHYGVPCSLQCPLNSGCVLVWCPLFTVIVCHLLVIVQPINDIKGFLRSVDFSSEIEQWRQWCKRCLSEFSLSRPTRYWNHPVSIQNISTMNLSPVVECIEMKCSTLEP